MQKPDNYIDWIPDNSATLISAPDTLKKAAGWAPLEKPPSQFFNWFWNIAGRWVRYFDKSSLFYDVTIGAGVDCTHATIAAALADSGVTTNLRVLLRDAIVGGATATSLTKAGWKIDAAPGVTFTKGVATTGLSVAAANIEIRGLRFVGFSVALDKPIAFTAAGDYGRVLHCNFATGGDIEVDDSSVTAGKKPIVLGCITEI